MTPGCEVNAPFKFSSTMQRYGDEGSRIKNGGQSLRRLPISRSPFPCKAGFVVDCEWMQETARGINYRMISRRREQLTYEDRRDVFRPA